MPSSGAADVARRKHTAGLHPEWSPMHAHHDALRVMVNPARDFIQPHDALGLVVGITR
jgi:hypothetical protein